MWKIFDIDIPENSKIQAYVSPDKSDYKMPVTIINGQHPGKTVLILAGIHSCEWVGTPTTIRLAQQIKPEELQGRLILVHMVNVTGFWNRRIRFMPEDGKNLNDIFPANHDQPTLSDRIAIWLEEEVYPHTDFIIDLHTGAPGQSLRPLLFFSMAPGVRDFSFAAAKCVNVPYLIESRSKSGPYSYAAWAHNIPGMLIERGCGGFCYDSWVQADIADCKRVLQHLDVYTGECDAVTEKQQLISPMEDLLADAEGIWYPAIEVDQVVKKGQLLGHLEDVWGNMVKEYFAEEDGVILYYTTALPIKPDYMLISYGAFRKMTEI